MMKVSMASSLVFGRRSKKKMRCVLMEEEKRIDERLDSIKVAMTSKGLYSFEVKRYYDFSHDEPKLVIASIKKIYEQLKESFNQG